MSAIRQYELISLDGTALLAADDDGLIADYNLALGTVDKSAALLDTASLGVGVMQWGRSVTGTLTDANASLTEVKVYLTGEDVFGNTLQETLTFSAAGVQESDYMFASISEVLVHADGVLDAGVDKLKLGWGSILALPVRIGSLGVIRTKRVDTTIDSGTVDLTYQSWEPTGGNIPNAAKRFYMDVVE
jgi:hypothetical protein